MKVLVGCEESQEVCKAFRKLGHEAYSCDILPCSGGHPEWHIQDDVLKHLDDGWDLAIFHPPCTYLTVTGNKWFKPEFIERFPDRQKKREEAIEFFIKLYESKIKKVAVENPVGIMSTVFRKPDQYIQPYDFGDSYSKKTGLWLKNLPILLNTEIVSKGEFVTYKSGKRMPEWYANAGLKGNDRAKIRNKTFPGIAKAMAEQWGGEDG